MLMFLPRWIQVLSRLDKMNIHEISKDSEIVYSHVWLIFKDFEKRKILICKKRGRINEYILTEKGIKLKKICEEIIGAVNNANE